MTNYGLKKSSTTLPFIFGLKGALLHQISVLVTIIQHTKRNKGGAWPKAELQKDCPPVQPCFVRFEFSQNGDRPGNCARCRFLHAILALHLIKIKVMSGLANMYF